MTRRRPIAMASPLTLAFLDPGHFHAALTLRRPHPAVAREILVHARPGPDLEAFLALVEAFNTRPEQPTAWQPVVHRSEAPLQRLLSDGGADAVVLAGRNDTKMADIARLHAAGLPVLADKPWVLGPEALADLEAATDGAGPPAMDIMTAHREDASRLAGRVIANPAVFGAFAGEDPARPAIDLETVHHLAKLVNGRPLVRPPWYFDVGVQGDGVVDVPSHMVHLAQWLVAAATGHERFEFDRDVRLDSARRWDTPVPAARFREITGAASWPPALVPQVRGDVLPLACNGEVRYRLCGLPVRLRSEWHLDEPAGGADMHRTVLRGTRADFLALLTPETGFRYRIAVRPHPGQDGMAPALERAVQAWQAEFPGLTLHPAGDWLQDADAATRPAWELVMPPEQRTTHEEHFALALEDFLAALTRGERPAHLDANLRCKYTLLARAAGLAGADGGAA